MRALVLLIALTLQIHVCGQQYKQTTIASAALQGLCFDTLLTIMYLENHKCTAFAKIKAISSSYPYSQSGKRCPLGGFLSKCLSAKQANYNCKCSTARFVF